MKRTIKTLLPFALIVIMTACGNMDTEEQNGADGARSRIDSTVSALSIDAVARSDREAYLFTCTNWSDWSSTGYTKCYMTAGACHGSWQCDYDADGLTTPRETEKCPGHWEPAAGTGREEYRIRQCFDENGSPLPIQRETRWILVRCGC